MANKHIVRLHWKLFFPIVGLLWLIIGITITYFVMHERQRLKYNLENRLVNVNNTIIDAYDRGVDLQSTVDFIMLFTVNTALDPLRITVYDDAGNMVADNPAATILLRDSTGTFNPGLKELWEKSGNATVQDMAYNNKKSMISSRMSDGRHIRSFAALPYEGEVLDFLSVDPMIWIAVIVLGVVSSVLAYFGSRAISRNVYALKDFAQAIASDKLPDDVDASQFSQDELGDVSRNLLSLYRDKIHAEQEKMLHERQIGVNVSHELNTPVGIIKGYIDTVLNDDNMPEEVRHKFLVRVQQNADRLVSLVNDVGMVMRLQENGRIAGSVTIDFHLLAMRLAEDIAQGHLADNMEFEYDVPEGCLVSGHESLLTNALLNLVYNSAKHSGGTKMSLCWLRVEEGMHVFSFADDGVGVDEEHLGRLFDLFYRVDSGRSRKNGGSGLGLALVQRIITAMGGKISVDNASTGGLRFTFTLPAVSAA